MTRDELNAILADHLKWCRTDASGRRANLSGADLSGADLRSADLRNANLRSADLSNANLRSADLSGADLRSADLRSANLSGANLRSANLSGADLSGAILPHTQVCPEEGAFIGWKKLRDGLVCKLVIGHDCERVSPIVGRKCRADAALVLRIEAPDGTDRSEGMSTHRDGFMYRTGEPVQCDTYDPNPLVECSGGIHFFISRREAVEYA